jgi:hypothetical protein
VLAAALADPAVEASLADLGVDVIAARQRCSRLTAIRKFPYPRVPHTSESLL